MSVTMKSELAFKVFPIVVGDVNPVIEFLFKLFFWDEPLNASLELMKEKDVAEHLKNYSLRLLNNGELKTVKYFSFTYLYILSKIIINIIIIFYNSNF